MDYNYKEGKKKNIRNFKWFKHLLRIYEARLRYLV